MHTPRGQKGESNRFKVQKTPGPPGTWWDSRFSNGTKDSRSQQIMAKEIDVLKARLSMKSHGPGGNNGADSARAHVYDPTPPPAPAQRPFFLVNCR